MHIQDNYGTFDEHTVPLLGTLDTDAVMQALKKINYDGYFTLEADCFFRAKSGWPHMKKMSPEVTERRLDGASFEIKKQAEALLYNVGKYILESYDCFEE